MRILITNHHLAVYYGSETATYTIARALRDAGHDVRLLTVETGPMSAILEKEGFTVLRTDTVSGADAWKPDIIHAHHSMMAIMARGFWPDVPIAFISHGVLPLLENPPSIDIGIGAYAAVSEEVATALTDRWGITGVSVIPNGIDTSRFAPHTPVNPTLKNILLLSNRATDHTLAVIREAAQLVGANVHGVGQRFQMIWDTPEVINRADLIISLGRGVLEAMACGRAALVYDYNGGDGMVTPDVYPDIKKSNFSGRCYRQDFTAQTLAAELKLYDPAMGQANRRIIEEHHNITAHVPLYEALYRNAMQSDAHRHACAVPLKELVFYQNIIRSGSRVHADYQKLKAAHADLQNKLKALKPRIVEMKTNFDRELAKLSGQSKPPQNEAPQPPMKIIGLTRIRNEEAIIGETLDHMATFCRQVYIYDDCSTDNTVAICRAHPIVKSIIEGASWDSDRARAEWQNRKAVLELGQKNAGQNDWFVYMDADERLDFDFSLLAYLDKTVIGIKMKLFDFYITADDVNHHYSLRQYCGPEYRSILMAFRNLPTLDYSMPDQRQVFLNHPGTVLEKGYVKHYGKGISIQQWEDTCDYYADHFPQYAAKWRARKGKAVHDRSSFGYPLITWDQKDTQGIALTREIETQTIYTDL